MCLFFRNFSNRFLPRDGRDLLFEALDGGEELENHHEDEEESCENDGIDITLDADDFREGIADARESHDDRHATPDNDADSQFDNGLTALMLEIIDDALGEHEEGDSKDDDLIECEGHMIGDEE